MRGEEEEEIEEREKFGIPLTPLFLAICIFDICRYQGAPKSSVYNIICGIKKLKLHRLDQMKFSEAIGI